MHSTGLKQHVMTSYSIYYSAHSLGCIIIHLHFLSSLCHESIQPHPSPASSPPPFHLQHKYQFSLTVSHLLILSMLPHFLSLFIHPSIRLSICLFISIGFERGEVNSPNGVICLQEMVGSGFPLAVQMSDTLLPSFTVMSEDMS